MKVDGIIALTYDSSILAQTTSTGMALPPSEQSANGVSNDETLQMSSDLALRDSGRIVRLASLAGVLMAVATFVVSCVLPVVVSSVQRHRLRRSEKHNGNDQTSSPSRMLVDIWTLSHLAYALLALLVCTTKNRSTVLLVITLMGLPWACTMWNPFCLLTEELHSQASLLALGEGHTDAGHSSLDALQVGHVLGLHNAAISVPQIISALLCCAIFTVTKNAYEGTVWSLAVGSLCALAAAFWSRKIL